MLEQHNDALQDTLPLRIRRRFDCSFLKIPNAFWLNKRIKADVEGSFNINASFLLTVDQLDQVVARNPITDRCLRAQSRKRIYSKSTQTARHIVDSVISGRSCCLPTRHQCHSGLMTSYKCSTGAIGYTATRKWSNYFIAIRAVRQRHDVTDDVRFRGWLAASSDADLITYDNNSTLFCITDEQWTPLYKNNSNSIALDAARIVGTMKMRFKSALSSFH